MRTLQFSLNGIVRNSLYLEKRFAKLSKFTADNPFVKFIKTTLLYSLLCKIKIETEAAIQNHFIQHNFSCPVLLVHIHQIFLKIADNHIQTELCSSVLILQDHNSFQACKVRFIQITHVHDWPRGSSRKSQLKVLDLTVQAKSQTFY